MSLKEENSLIVNNLLNKTFFAGWKSPDVTKYQNYKTLELVINGKCDLACRYCYITRFGDKLYPKEIHQDDVVRKNTKMLLSYLSENGYKPRVEIFSGETLMQNIGYDVLDMAVDFCSSYKGEIVIPTNMNFVMHDQLFQRYQKIYERAKSLDVKIHLSASVDGLYCDVNRPFRNNSLKRDYDKIFDFASHNSIAFHPMIYCEEIEHWKDNFLWFQSMFKKYKIPWNALYLLEVRNSEWTVEQIREFGKFLKFLVIYIRDKFKDLPNKKFFRTVLQDKLFNLFGLFFTIGRGTGCSIQSTMQVRLADLSVFPCHRLTYEYFKMYRFLTDDEKVIGIEGINPELAVAHQSMDHSTFPYCQECLLKTLCNGQCLGSMYENSGDLFTPVPNVCLLEHEKVSSIINTLYEIGVFPECLDLLNQDKRFSIEIVHNMSKGEK